MDQVVYEETYSPTQEENVIEIQDDAMNEGTYIPESDDRQNENWFPSENRTEVFVFLLYFLIFHANLNLFVVMLIVVRSNVKLM